ncbi:MAG: hypothetical protein IH908_14110 [Proteobacteria bacterium]|nr:hypothetical protein [Pseudomonadota bacterium]
MMKKIGLAWVVAIFVVGIVIGALGGALIVTVKNMRFETSVLTLAVADSSFSVVPTLLAFNEANLDKKLHLIESAARGQLNAGIVVMHSNMQIVSDEERDTLQGILRSITSKRERLKIGQFDDPPKDHIEDILAAYAD